MKKWAVLISAVGLAFSVSGYEDQQGNKMQINRDDVSQIIKR